MTLFDEHRSDGRADFLGVARIGHRDSDVESWQLLGARLRHRKNRRHFDGFLQARDQVIHRSAVHILRIQIELPDDRFQA